MKQTITEVYHPDELIIQCDMRTSLIIDVDIKMQTTPPNVISEDIAVYKVKALSQKAKDYFKSLL